MRAEFHNVTHDFFEWRLQAGMPGARRPPDTWEDVLMHEAQAAINSVVVTGSWRKSEKEALLAELVRECAKIAGQPFIEDAHHL